MKCILISFFNSHNIGDVVISDMLYKLLSKKYKVDKFSYTGGPLVLNNTNNVSVNNSNIRGKLKLIISNALNRIHLGAIIKKYSYINLKKMYLDEFESKICKNDILIIGGGNMIFDINKYSRSGFKFLKFIELAKKYNKKVFAISIGIGPFATQKQELNAVNALEKCDYITFRDKNSFEIYKKYNKNLDNVFVSIDPVFLFPYSIKPIDTTTRVIGLNILNDKLLGKNLEQYEKIIKGYITLAMNLAKNNNNKIVLFSTEANDYVAVYDVYHNLIKNYSNIEVREINNINELLELYSELSILIGTRMHSMIIAFTQHIPVIGLSWQAKVEAMFDIIDSRECLFEYDKIEDNINSIISSCENKLNNLESEREEIVKKLSLIREKSNINSKILSKLSVQVVRSK